MRIHKLFVFFAKDYIETSNGLIFAVVADGVETGKVRCFLRYLSSDGCWRKVHTEEANRYLAEHYPHYLFYSRALDAGLHGVDIQAIVRHYSPRPALKQLLQRPPGDAAQADLQQLCRLLQCGGIEVEHLGITGSLLLGLQNKDSDIDLVCYDRKVFHRLRAQVQHLIARNQCQALNDADWQAAYKRRACDLTPDEYIRHEQRKYNKAVINRRKFDLSLVAADSGSFTGKHFSKLGPISIETKVTDDTYSFDYPAEFTIDHPEIVAVVCFTATYIAQAQVGERIAVAGQLESDGQGVKRIVVGSSREAAGEYIKVLW